MTEITTMEQFEGLSLSEKEEFFLKRLRHLPLILYRAGFWDSPRWFLHYYQDAALLRKAMKEEGYTVNPGKKESYNYIDAAAKALLGGK